MHVRWCSCDSLTNFLFKANNDRATQTNGALSFKLQAFIPCPWQRHKKNRSHYDPRNKCSPWFHLSDQSKKVRRLVWVFCTAKDKEIWSALSFTHLWEFSAFVLTCSQFSSQRYYQLGGKKCQIVQKTKRHSLTRGWAPHLISNSGDRFRTVRYLDGCFGNPLQKEPHRERKGSALKG